MKDVKNADHGFDFSDVDDEKCVIFIKGEQTRTPFDDSKNRAAAPLELVYTGVAFMPTVLEDRNIS